MRSNSSDKIFFSLPGNDFFETIEPNEKGSDTFVYKGFSKEDELFEIKGERKKIGFFQNITPALSEKLSNESVTKSKYLRQVEQSIEFSKSHNGKIVLSRTVSTKVDKMPVNSWLIRLRQAFPNTLVYLLDSAEYGVWLGATPETLISKSGNLFKTMALAGTKWNDEPFEEKEFQEQALVVKSIEQKLVDENLEISPRYEHHFGALRHLRTDISWHSESDILSFANQLHPTPAICGFPENQAYDEILKIETHQRKLYTGFLGLISENENSHLFVNLRCMQLFRGSIQFYAGGGINAMSQAEVEWEETIRKMKSVLNVIQVNA